MLHRGGVNIRGNAACIRVRKTQGLIKVAIDPDSKEILGAAFHGAGGDGVAHRILDVRYAKTPYTML